MPELVGTRPPDVQVDVAILLPNPQPDAPRDDGMSGDRFDGTEFTDGITIVDAVNDDGGTEFTEFELMVMFIPEKIMMLDYCCCCCFDLLIF